VAKQTQVPHGYKTASSKTPHENIEKISILSKTSPYHDPPLFLSRTFGNDAGYVHSLQTFQSKFILITNPSDEHLLQAHMISSILHKEVGKSDK
jgi:hypothetical protein